MAILDDVFWGVNGPGRPEGRGPALLAVAADGHRRPDPSRASPEGETGLGATQLAIEDAFGAATSQPRQGRDSKAQDGSPGNGRP